MRVTPTILGRWTSTVVRALDAEGHDGNALARLAGIDPDELVVDGARIPLTASTKLWRLGVEVTGDPCFGLTVARFVRPSTLSGLGMGFVSSVRLRDALERVNRFSAVVLDPKPETWISEHDDVVEWHESFRRHPVRPEPEAMEAILGSIVLCGRFLLGRNFHPKEVFLCRRDPIAEERFRSFFGCPVHFGCDHYSLTFDRADVERPIATGSPAMAAVADELAARSVSDLTARTTMSAQVRATIADGDWSLGAPMLSRIAEDLALSRRTIQRRLRLEGTSVRELADGIQRRRAHRLLVVEGLTVERVADRLGFHDASSFRRAFRRWTGMTPSTYTTEHLTSQNGPVPSH